MNRNIKITAIVAACLVAAVAVYWLFDPAANLFPRCPFYVVTGLKCPGCGAQRAVHALLHGDLRGAWNQNAMLLLVVPVIVLMLWSEYRAGRHPRLNAFLTSTGFVMALVALLAGWMIVRNIAGC